MAHSGWFNRSALGEPWRSYESLAELCEQAKLTDREAESVLLWCRGFGWAEIGRVTGRSRSNACRDFWNGVHKISASLPDLRNQRRDWARLVLYCFRNSRLGPSSAGVAVQDYYGLWTWRKSIQVVTVDDLAGPEQAVLQTLLDETRGAEEAA